MTNDVAAYHSDFDISNARAVKRSVSKIIRLHVREINAMTHRWSDDALITSVATGIARAQRIVSCLQHSELRVSP